MKALFAGVALATFLAVSTPAVAADDLSASARLAMPGPSHALLEPLIGTWDVEMRVYPGPGAEPFVAQGLSATREWILGGRYVQEHLSGDVFGAPSERIAILGYNNLEQRFELATFDTFEPGSMIYQGAAMPDGTISVLGDSTEAGMGAEPTGRKRTIRFEFEMTEAGSVERIFVRYPGGEEFLFVEQIFTPS
ncbi:DUF1579 family protein [Salinarimonas sp. NSM]|uniref:DUF1579 family protein n=1 Tax=Salinarimonas sp. NSM TaxID=3458003 RepID=UPI0040362C29